MTVAEVRQSGATSFSPLRIGIVAGVAVGTLFSILAAATSPLLALGLLVGTALAAGFFLRPEVGFLTMALLVPVERFGRLTNDGATFTISIMRMLGFLLVAAVIGHMLFLRRAFRWPNSFLWYAAYMALGLISLTWTTDLQYGVNQAALQLGSLMFVFITVHVVRNLRQARVALALWMFSVVAIDGFTIYQWNSPTGGVIANEDYYLRAAGLTTQERFAAVIFDPPSYAIRQKRAIGSTSHPAEYGLDLLLSLPIFLYFFRTTSSAWLRVLIVAGGALTCVNVVLTNTRAVLATFVACIVACVIFDLLKMRIWVVALLLMSCVAGVFVAPRDFRDRVLDFDKWISESRDSSFGERLYLMKVSVDLISDHPFFGVGLANQVDLAERGKLDWRDRAKSPHNDFLATLMEVGLVGFVFVAGFLISLYRNCVFAKRVGAATANPRLRLLMAATQVQIIVVLFFGLQGEPLTQPMKGFWLTVGLVLAISQTLKERAILAEKRLTIGLDAQAT